ncbi:TATA-binding protein-associated factor 2N-like isoform X2 [Hetaerina americana]|uniref:TATA-binding protein-associated factor 2N-like isoform X2 n=1 Tax=Hetaerina americana TaxID=62018 RepID=UPI003A7F3444
MAEESGERGPGGYMRGRGRPGRVLIRGRRMFGDGQSFRGRGGRGMMRGGPPTRGGMLMRGSRGGIPRGAMRGGGAPASFGEGRPPVEGSPIPVTQYRGGAPRGMSSRGGSSLGTSRGAGGFNRGGPGARGTFTPRAGYNADSGSSRGFSPRGNGFRGLSRGFERGARGGRGAVGGERGGFAERFPRGAGRGVGGGDRGARPPPLLGAKRGFRGAVAGLPAPKRGRFEPQTRHNGYSPPRGGQGSYGGGFSGNGYGGSGGGYQGGYGGGGDVRPVGGYASAPNFGQDGYASYKQEDSYEGYSSSAGYNTGASYDDMGGDFSSNSYDGYAAGGGGGGYGKSEYGTGYWAQQ